MKVKNSQIIETFQAIAGMPRLHEAPNAVVALARNLRILKKEYEAYLTDRAEIAKKLFGEVEDVKKDHAAMPEFIAQHKILLDTEVEVPVKQFTFAELNLDKNGLSANETGAIHWLISDF